MELSFLELGVMFALIGFAGFVDSIAGGGGMITIPTYLALGVPPDLVLGTNKTVSTTGTSIAVFRFAKNKAILWKLMAGAIVLSMLGSYIGASLSKYLSRSMMTGILLVVIPAILLIQRKIDIRAKASEGVKGFDRTLAIKAAVIGFVIGGYDGLFGPGTGTFLLIAFVLFVNMDYRQASANGRIINYISNLSAFFVFLYEGRIYWPVVGVALIAAMIGNYLGSGMVLNNAEKVVRPVFQVVLIALLAKCVYDLI
ncbi:TSUP family transporter [Pseudobacteriovorax antillogorgiicola]|uniref:Probable membrane transporter protein n=1 Tax=Pseudobacteriovorax antillogorgiicola TaxID=1513793 RepID=A0A1Y6BTW5_9BACT|nr:TSUP family transporter [Pseudobacteriovorax antillogorgiicola]TCS52447.1 hypothetical protein EDD56_109192 [Pseudobacteriovorax antillogorgiicola]SMF28530.1 hypothetical protein SAMN06296036_10922 [Pseudobacteriovorax antillogorgiicola]